MAARMQNRNRSRKQKREHKKEAKRKRDQQRARRRQQSTPSTETNGASVSRYIEWFLPSPEIFAGLKQHRNTTWTFIFLITQTLFWAWSESKNVTDAFTSATRQCNKLDGAALNTYQGLMGALVRWTGELMPLLWSRLHQLMQQLPGGFFEIAGWVPIAFDGSRSSAPRTEDNEQAFCAPNYGKGKTAKYRKKQTKGMRRRQNEKHKPLPQEPQAWITMLWHMGLRLPWMWRLGPSNSSERDHVKEMLRDGEFPENTLFCGDAGFVGYPLWFQIVSRGHHFLVRVGANVNLLSKSADYELKGDDRVLCWPQDAQRAGQPPLELRLVQVQIGNTQVWMLTNVLKPSQLTKKQIVAFYKMRWGIEIEFRGLKQTLGNAKLCCRNPERLLCELHWSIMAMAVAELFALKEQLSLPPAEQDPDDPPADPIKRSLANTIRALRNCLADLNEVPEAGRDLCSQLRQAVTDSYDRPSSKKARHARPNPDKKPLGNPKVRGLNAKEQKKMQQRQQKQSKKTAA